MFKAIDFEIEIFATAEIETAIGTDEIEIDSSETETAIETFEIDYDIATIDLGIHIDLMSVAALVNDAGDGKSLSLKSLSHSVRSCLQ